MKLKNFGEAGGKPGKVTMDGKSWRNPAKTIKNTR